MLADTQNLKTDRAYTCKQNDEDDDQLVDRMTNNVLHHRP